MRMLAFEWKKLWRMAGLRNLLAVILALDLAAVLLGGLSEPSAAESEMHANNYTANISYVIRAAERNRTEYELTAGRNSYPVRYQEQVIERYSTLLERGASPLPVRGWNAFFDHEADDVLLIVSAILLGTALILTERDNGTHILPPLSLRGRSVYRSKLALLTVTALILPPLMNGITAVGIAIRFGLSSPMAPLCSVLRFAYCPSALSILSYLALSSLARSAALLTLMLLSAWASSILGSYLAAPFVSAGAVAAGLGLSHVGGNGLDLLNLYSLILTDPLWERYRAWRLFGLSVPLVGTAAVLLPLLCLALASLFMLTARRTAVSSSFARWEKETSKKLSRLWDARRRRFPRRRPRRRSLLFSEAKKSLVKARLLVLCAVMLVIKLWYADATAPTVYAAERYYKQICYELEGPLTEEKRQRIEDALAQSAAIISRESQMRNDLMSGLISSEQYSAYSDEYTRAELQRSAYTRLDAQCRRIDAAAERGQQAILLYDSGWEAALSRQTDLLLLTFLALFFCGTYAMEYGCGMDRTAKTTARGLSAMHQGKLKWAVLFTLLAFPVYLGVDAVILARAFSFPCATASLASARETSLSMPLWLALASSSLCQLTLSLVISVSTCLLSRFLKRIYLTLPATLVILSLLAMAQF